MNARIAFVVIALVTLVVVALVAIGGVLTLGIAGTGVASKLADSQEKQAALQVTKVEQALEIYTLRHNALPSDVDALVDDGALKRSDTVDPWGHPFVIQGTKHEAKVVCAGPDGRLGTADDIGGRAAR
ncbi:MAG: type II secretion system protein GspG [Myxococcota bacterium]